MTARTTVLALLAGVLAATTVAAGRSWSATPGHHCAVVADGSAEGVAFTTRTDTGRPVPIEGILMRPPGAGPFPAVVLLHGGPGLQPPHCYRNALKLMVGWRYVALAVDSFSARGRNQARLGHHTFVDQARDAHAAKAFLSTLPFVRAGSVGVVGWSMGGGATLVAVTRDASSRLDRQGAFKAAAAFYPVCLGALMDLDAPLVVLIGDKDRETPAENCRRMKRLGDDSYPYELKIYPGAGHVFDSPRFPGYDSAAAEDALARLERFLAKHLK